jgi:RNA polymerase sigma-70 factor (ECF subfamily)
LGGYEPGNESAFVELVGRHHHAMVRLARTYVPSEAVAEEVVKDTWLAALRGLSGFEGRAAVRTWLYRIVVNRARSIGTNEHKHLPVGDVDPAVDSARFRRDGSWSHPPAPWVDEVEDRVHAESMAKSIRKAIDDCPLPNALCSLCETWRE